MHKKIKIKLLFLIYNENKEFSWNIHSTKVQYEGPYGLNVNYFYVFFSIRYKLKGILFLRKYHMINKMKEVKRTHHKERRIHHKSISWTCNNVSCQIVNFVEFQMKTCVSWIYFGMHSNSNGLVFWIVWWLNIVGEEYKSTKSIKALS